MRLSWLNPRTFSCRSVGLLVLVLIAGGAAGGCSVPFGAAGRSLTVGYARSSDATRQVHTAVPGLDLRLGTAHDGLNLGWSSVQMAAATPGEPVRQRLGYLPPLGYAWTNGAAVQRVGWFFWQRPVITSAEPAFVAAGHVGLAFTLNPHQRGLDLGLSRQTWLITPTNHNGVLRLSLRPGTVPVFQHEETKPDTKPSP
jgi:hypothetical protein